MRTAVIDHLALNVSDVDRSLAFYQEMLGFDVERLAEFRGGKVSFPSIRVNPDTIIDLMSGPDLAKDGRHPLNHFAFRLAAGELELLHRRLAEHEVEIVEPPRPRWGARGTGLSMKVLDPDGNIVELKAAAED